MALVTSVIPAAKAVVTLTFNDSRILGFANTTTDNSSGTSEEVYIDAILDLALNTNMPPTFPPSSTNTYHRTSNDPLGGVYPDADFVDDPTGSDETSLTLDGSYKYLFAKYNGKNSYRVLWYIGDLAAGEEISMPLSFSQYPDGGSQYAISHSSVFNEMDTPDDTPGVPDGGTTLASLGLALLGLGATRRLLTKKA